LLDQALHLRCDGDIDLHDLDADAARTQSHHFGSLRTVWGRTPGQNQTIDAMPSEPIGDGKAETAQSSGDATSSARQALKPAGGIPQLEMRIVMRHRELADVAALRHLAEYIRDARNGHCSCRQWAINAAVKPFDD